MRTPQPAQPWLVTLARPAGHLVAFYPLLTALVGLVVAVCWGGVMGEYDAVHVFWNDHPLTGVLNGVGVALVLGQLVLAAYLLDRSRRLRALALFRDRPGGRHFQPREPLPRNPAWGYWATWMLLLVVVAFPAVVRGNWFRIGNIRGDGPWAINDVVRTDDPATKEEADYVEKRAGGFRSAMALARLWFPLGLGLTAAAVGGAWLAARKAFPVRVPVPGPRRSPVQLALRLYALRMFRGPVYFAWTVFVALAVGYAAMVAVHVVVEPAYCPTYPASVSILLLAGFLAGVAWRFTALAGRRVWLYPVVLALPVALFRIPAMQTEYRVPGMTVNDPTGGTYYDRATPQLKDYADLRQRPAADFGLVPDDAALTAWEARMAEVFPGERQPVVVVAVSGGASASALYTADVLYTLEEQFPGFADRVRVISGASGGMLGAAYFVTQLRPGGVIYQTRTSPEYRRYFAAQQWLTDIREGSADGNEADAEREREAALAAFRALARDRRAVFFRGLEQDFLGPLVQKWVHKDMPLYFVPGTTTNDRGAALEASWSRHLQQDPLAPPAKAGALDIGFTSLRDDERAGRIPSLVFSPMMVEDGRQLLISNLGLDYMVDTRGWGRPTDAAVSAVAGGAVPTAGRADADGRLLAVTGMEFFRLFPKADEFRLGTAVRLNASFPYFSPLATLPTNPARHVVDAGYYDNYGTTVATKWVARHADRLARRADAGRPAAILLRIRCFEFEGQKREFVTTREERALDDERKAAADAGRPERTVHTHAGLFTLTAPLAGLFSAWRANMVYRGDERVAAVDSLMAARGARFEYPITECRVNPSLNWVLTPDTTVRIHTDAWVQARMPSAVSNFIQARTTQPPASLPPAAAGRAKEAAAASKQRTDPKATRTVVQATPQYQEASAAERQALESLADLANVLADLNLADPASPPPGK